MRKRGGIIQYVQKGGRDGVMKLRIDRGVGSYAQKGEREGRGVKRVRSGVGELDEEK